MAIIANIVIKINKTMKTDIYFLELKWVLNTKKFILRYFLFWPSKANIHLFGIELDSKYEKVVTR